MPEAQPELNLVDGSLGHQSREEILGLVYAKLGSNDLLPQLEDQGRTATLDEIQKSPSLLEQAIAGFQEAVRRSLIVIPYGEDRNTYPSKTPCGRSVDDIINDLRYWARNARYEVVRPVISNIPHAIEFRKLLTSVNIAAPGMTTEKLQLLADMWRRDREYTRAFILAMQERYRRLNWLADEGMTPEKINYLATVFDASQFIGCGKQIAQMTFEELKEIDPNSDFSNNGDADFNEVTRLTGYDTGTWKRKLVWDRVK